MSENAKPIDWGGNAFPESVMNVEGQIRTSSDQGVGGMTLRDWFAGMAMQAWFSTPLFRDKSHFDVCAKECYEVADALIKERNKR